MSLALKLFIKPATINDPPSFLFKLRMGELLMATVVPLGDPVMMVFMNPILVGSSVLLIRATLTF